jgi:hypothetical protein
VEVAIDSGSCGRPWGLRGMVPGVRQSEGRKDAIEERVSSSRESSDAHPGADADPGAEAGKSAHSPEEPPRFGRFGSHSDHDRPHMVPILGQRALLPVSGHPDRRIAAIATLQRGLVARHQLLAAGLATGATERMLASGELCPEHQGRGGSGDLRDRERRVGGLRLWSSAAPAGAVGLSVANGAS